MLFNSFEYIFFLPLVFLLYWFVFKKRRQQNLLIVAASYFFYGQWDWRFLSLIFLTTLTTYLSGLIISRSNSWPVRRCTCAANIVLNFGILGYFKYFNFFIDNLRALLLAAGWEIDWFTVEVLLPVGISFYTFQAVSYTIDVYRGSTKATSDFIAYMAYVAFFPQLVAGPIERSTQLLPQFDKERAFDYNSGVNGMRRILWGFFKKLVIADNCALMANFMFNNYTDRGSLALVSGAICFTFQIYADFSGYSDIAIGSAELFGFRLSQNFHYPYFSRNIAEFWRRWHITLNRWFVDYVYIPLGGSRCSTARRMCNVLIVFFLSGLWHGDNWTFVTWGLYNGLLLCILILLKRSKPRTPDARWGDVGSIIATFILTVFGWIVFRAESLTEAAGYISNIFCNSHNMTHGLSGPIDMSHTLYTYFFILVLMAAEWMQRRRDFALDLDGVGTKAVRWGIYLAIFFTVLIFAAPQSIFIYFQF